MAAWCRRCCPWNSSREEQDVQPPEVEFRSRASSSSHSPKQRNEEEYAASTSCPTESDPQAESSRDSLRERGFLERPLDAEAPLAGLRRSDMAKPLLGESDVEDSQIPMKTKKSSSDVASIARPSQLSGFEHQMSGQLADRMSADELNAEAHLQAGSETRQEADEDAARLQAEAEELHKAEEQKAGELRRQAELDAQQKADEQAQFQAEAEARQKAHEAKVCSRIDPRSKLRYILLRAIDSGDLDEALTKAHEAKVCSGIDPRSKLREILLRARDSGDLEEALSKAHAAKACSRIDPRRKLRDILLRAGDSGDLGKSLGKIYGAKKRSKLRDVLLQARESGNLDSALARVYAAKEEKKARLQAEQEAHRKAEEEAESEARQEAEEEQLEADAEALQKAAEERKQLQEQTDALRRDAEALREEEKKARLQAEQEAKRKAEEEAESEARRKAEEDAEAEALRKATEEKAGPLWSLEQTFVLCSPKDLANWPKFEGRAPLLDKTSVRAALEELNANGDVCPGGICVVFSSSRKIYTVIYRRGLQADARKLYGLQDDTGSTETPFTPQLTELPLTAQATGAAADPPSPSRKRFSCDLNSEESVPAVEPEAQSGFMGRLQAFVSAKIISETPQPEPNFDAGKLVMTHNIALNDRYDVLRELGAGAQGTTYVVRRKGTEEDFVAKETKNTNPAGVKTFMAEFAKMRDFRHPNCIKVIELLENAPDKQVFIIEEIAQGGDLYKYMEAVRQEASHLTEDLIAGLFYQAMAGVAFLHTSGCIHNDLKPDNILVMEQHRPGLVPRVVVADYGCATLRANRNQVIFGDPRYQAPESLRAMMAYFADRNNKPKQQGPKADVWSMGATLYELLSGGILPFLYERCADKFTKLEDERWVSLRDAVLSPERVEVFPSCTGASEQAESILLQLLEKEPSKRPTAQEALADPWFTAKHHRRMSNRFLANVEFTACKSKARQILLNAMATKMKTDHVTQCYNIFSSFDRDKNGTLSRSDFKQALDTLGQNTRNADAIFDRADVDRSGTLEFNEFVALTYDWREGHKTGKLDEYLKDFLADLGAKDGSISKEGLRNFFNGALKPQELRDLEHSLKQEDNEDIASDDLADFIASATFFSSS